MYADDTVLYIFADSAQLVENLQLSFNVHQVNDLKLALKVQKWCKVHVVLRTFISPRCKDPTLREDIKNLDILIYEKLTFKYVLPSHTANVSLRVIKN